MPDLSLSHWVRDGKGDPGFSGLTSHQLHVGSGSLASKVAVLERPETDVVTSQLAGNGEKKGGSESQLGSGDQKGS